MPASTPGAGGYTISASVATSASQELNPFTSAGTSIVFGNASGFDTQNTPTNDQPSTDTATTALGGNASAAVQAPTGAPGQPASLAGISSTPSLLVLVLLAGAGLFLYHSVAHGKKISL